MSSINTQPSQTNPLLAQIESSKLTIQRNLAKLQGRTLWKLKLSDQDQEVKNIKEAAQTINACIDKLKADNAPLSSSEDLNAALSYCEDAEKSISELKRGLVNDKPTKFGPFWLIESVVRTFAWVIGLRSPDVDNIKMSDIKTIFTEKTKYPVPAGKSLPAAHRVFHRTSQNPVQDVIGTAALLQVRTGDGLLALNFLEANIAKSGLNDYISPSLLANISIPESAYLYRESGTKFILVDHTQAECVKTSIEIKKVKDKIEITKTDSSGSSSTITSKDLQKLLSNKPIASSSAIKKAIMNEAAKSLPSSNQEEVAKDLSAVIGKNPSLVDQAIYTKLWKDSKNDIYLSRIDTKGKIDHLKVDVSLQGVGGFTAIKQGVFSKIVASAQSPVELASACGTPVERAQERLDLEKRLKGQSEVKTEAELTIDARYVINMGRVYKTTLPPFIDAIGKDDKGVLQVFRFNTAKDPSNIQAEVIPFSISTLDPRGSFAIKGAEPLPELLPRLETIARSAELETRKANRPIVDFVKEEARDSTSFDEGLKRFFPKSGQDKIWCIIKNEGVAKWVQNAFSTAVDFLSVGFLSPKTIPNYELKIGDKSIPIEIGKDNKITLKFKGVSGLNRADTVCASIADLKQAVSGYISFDEFAQKYDRAVLLSDQELKKRLPVSEFNIENQLKNARLVLRDKSKEFAGICGLSVDSESVIKPSYVFNYIDKAGIVQSKKITVTDLGWSVDQTVYSKLDDLLKSISMEKLTFKSVQDPDFIAKVSGTTAIGKALSDPQLSRGYATERSHIELELRNIAAKLGNNAAKGVYRVWSDNGVEDHKKYFITYLDEGGQNCQTQEMNLDNNKGIVAINNKSYDVKKDNWLAEIVKDLKLTSSQEEKSRTESLKELNSFVGSPIEKKDEELIQHKAQMLALINPGLLDGFSYLKKADGNKSFTVVSYDKEGKTKESPVDLSKLRAGDFVGDANQETIKSLTTKLGIKKGKNDIDTVIMSNQGVFQGSCTTKSAAELHVAKIFEGMPDSGATWMLRWPGAPASWNPFTIIRRMFYTELALNPSLTIVERTVEQGGEVNMVSHDFFIEPQNNGRLKIFDEKRVEKGECDPKELKKFIEDNVSSWRTNENIPFLGSIEVANARIKSIKDFEDSIIFQNTDSVLVKNYRPTLSSKDNGLHLDFKQKGRPSLPLDITRTVQKDGKIKYTMSCSQGGFPNVKTEAKTVSADQLKDDKAFKKWIMEEAEKFYSAMPVEAPKHSVSQPAAKARVQQAPSSQVSSQQKLKPLPQVEIVSARKQQTIDEIQKNKAAEDARQAQIDLVAKASPQKQQLQSDGSVLIGTRNQISAMLKGMFFKGEDDSCVEGVLDSLEVTKQGVLTLEFHALAAELCSELDLLEEEPPINFDPDDYTLGSPQESLAQFLTGYVDDMREDLKSAKVISNQTITKNISAGIVKKPEIGQKANPKSLDDVLNIFGKNSEEQGIYLRKFMQYQTPKVAVSVCKAAGITTFQPLTPNEFVCKLLPELAKRNPEVFAVFMARDCIVFDPSIKKGNQINGKILGNSVLAMGEALKAIKENNDAKSRFIKTFNECKTAYTGKDKDVASSLDETIGFLDGKKTLKDLWPDYY